MPYVVKDLGLTIDRTAIPEEQVRWKSRLCLVSSPPHRFIGLASCDDNGEFDIRGGLYAAAVYVCNISMQPHGAGGYRLVPMPQAVVPLDLIGNEPRCRVQLGHYENAIWILAQSEEFQRFFYTAYLDLLDPPRVVKPLIEVPR